MVCWSFPFRWTFGQRWEPKLGLAEGSFEAAMSDVWTAGALGTVTEAGVHAAMRDRLGITEDQVDAVMADMWVQYLGTPNTELIEYARGLRPAVRTGILSNSFVGAGEREQAAYGLVELVDECMYSHEVGMRKPDPGLWELACKRMGFAPAEVLFVDDVPRVRGRRPGVRHAGRAVREHRAGDRRGGGRAARGMTAPGPVLRSASGG